jgi:hypothetical protein
MGGEQPPYGLRARWLVFLLSSPRVNTIQHVERQPRANLFDAVVQPRLIGRFCAHCAVLLDNWPVKARMSLAWHN